MPKSKSAPELQEEVSKYRPNDKITVVVNRDGETKKFKVTLRNTKNTTAIIKKKDLAGIELHGTAFNNISDDLKKKLGIESGIKAMSVGTGAFKDAGMKSGFIITHVDRTPIRNAEQFQKLMKQKSGGVLFEGIYTNGQRAYYGIGI